MIIHEIIQKLEFLENQLHQLCDIAKIARESKPREYEEPFEYSLETRLHWLKHKLLKDNDK
jgi:hypothetical protein